MPHLKNEKSISSINALFFWKENVCSSKDSIKAISDVIETPYFIFSKNFVRLVNVIKSFDFGHIQKCPFWSMPLHFRNASTASVYTVLNIAFCSAHIRTFYCFSFRNAIFGGMISTEGCCLAQLLKVIVHSVSDRCFFAPLRKAIPYHLILL
jgi:hypothetical protein